MLPNAEAVGYPGDLPPDHPDAVNLDAYHVKGKPPTRGKPSSGGSTATMLTIMIYRAVVEAGRPVTAPEVFDAIRHEMNRTDTYVWWTRARSNRHFPLNLQGQFDFDQVAPVRVRTRLGSMAGKGLLVRCGRRGSFTLYSPGDRQPQVVAFYEVESQDRKIERHLDVIKFLDAARVALAKRHPKVVDLRPIIAEAVRLLQAMPDEEA